MATLWPLFALAAVVQGQLQNGKNEAIAEVQPPDGAEIVKGVTSPPLLNVQEARLHPFEDPNHPPYAHLDVHIPVMVDPSGDTISSQRDSNNIAKKQPKAPPPEKDLSTQRPKKAKSQSVRVIAQ